jgi:two-component system, chemotaxis family, CheB/CheR fusion protein
VLVMFQKQAQEQRPVNLIVADKEPFSQHLEEELINMKRELVASRERYEYQAEELKAANEELHAMNEETRSTAEELETSKEELQSINEELRTVNQELKVQVEETAIASNNLQNLINSVDLATIFLDRTFRVKLFSPAAKSIFNLIGADRGRHLSDITNNLEYTKLLEDADLVLQTLLPVEREVATTQSRIYLMRVLPYRTEEDRINGIVITFFDITALKQIEQQLRGSEERLRLLIESARDYAIFTHDTNRRVSSWNSGAELVFGYAEQEILGYSSDIFFVPEDRATSVPEKEVEKALLEGKAENERWHLKKDGSRFYGSGMVRPIYDSRNNLMGFLKIMRDLTEHKRSEEALKNSEERLRVSMNSATDYAIISLDTNGYITTWSTGAELIFGFSEDEVKGRHTEIIFTPEDRTAGAPGQEMRTAAIAGRAQDERWHLGKDGSRFYMSGVMTPIISNNSLTGFVKVARNTTTQKLAEQQKDEFIGIASHELKTPVTSIKSYTELLLDSFEKGDGVKNAELVKKLNTQVDRLIDLIYALLDTTRISEGRLALNLQDVDLNALVEEHVANVRFARGAHSIIFKKGRIRTVYADPERIGQVVSNLLNNAIKYSPEGGDIVVSSQEVDGGVKISVADNGIGIDEASRAKIFERFFRVQDTRVKGLTGMGLGLYISAGIVQRHGGSIGMEDKPEKGSIFYFIIPYATVNNQ